MNAEEKLRLAEERVEADRQRRIDAAIAAVAAPGTDSCIDCGDAIPEERRIAAPWAKRCIECQEFYEAERLSK
ncbi:TraR/DksA C4-type zinc finger protein [Pleomorphomonas koreensis]|uniref:TraR/DksA C4-type zinc finger protein n=1 Tax=Pleomorphomonas koreensis TaxID=257440 RepID=UPI0004147072|nr:TraR/DksA C4-type zinc finger protein [Pleomorphomonas koreensis]